MRTSRTVSCGTAAWRAQELELNEYCCATLIPEALAQPSMPRLRSLKLGLVLRGIDSPTDEPFAPLWAAPWFSQLQELSIEADQGFGRPGLAPLPAAPLLRKLVVDNSGRAPALSAGDGRALAAAALPELRELELYNIRPGLVAALAAAPWLGRLSSLKMSSGGHLGPLGGLDAAAGRTLAAAPTPLLKQLLLYNVEPGFMAAWLGAVSAAAPWLGGLEHLTLRSHGDLLGGGDGLTPPLSWPLFFSRRSWSYPSLTMALRPHPIRGRTVCGASDGAVVWPPASARVVQLPPGHARRLRRRGAARAGRGPPPQPHVAGAQEGVPVGRGRFGGALERAMAGHPHASSLSQTHWTRLGTGPSRCCTCRACGACAFGAPALRAQAWLLS
jgi:hypothetical protein